MTGTFSIHTHFDYNRTEKMPSLLLRRLHIAIFGEKLSFSAITKFCRRVATQANLAVCNFDISKPLIRIPMHLNECQKQKPTMCV